MTTEVLGDIKCPNGTYIKDGEEKTSWLRCGILLKTDKGYRIKLDCLPIDMGEGWFSVWPREDRNEGYTSASKSRPQSGQDDENPF
jgi:hypothetical protein